jgi:hypothetical protein
MGPNDDENVDDLHQRWKERLAKWLRRPEGAEEKPTTAVSARMRENREEPRE